MESNKSPLTKVGFKIENIICNQKSSIFKFWFWSLLPVGDKLALDWTRFEKASSYNKTTYLSTTPAKKKLPIYLPVLQQNYLPLLQQNYLPINHSKNKTNKKPTYVSTTPTTKLLVDHSYNKTTYRSTTPTTKLPK